MIHSQFRLYYVTILRVHVIAYVRPNHNILKNIEYAVCTQLNDTLYHINMHDQFITSPIPIACKVYIVRHKMDLRQDTRLIM